MLLSKTQPWICKWVTDGGTDVRDNPYRLNTNQAFGQLSFSPDHRSFSPDTNLFNQEWGYIFDRVPERMTEGNDVTKIWSYIGESVVKDEGGTIYDNNLERNGSGESGNGRILGDSSVSTQNKTNINNICMSNRVGIDVWNSKDGVTSFDIEIYATYGDTTTNIAPDTLVKYNASTMQSAVNGSKNSTKKTTKTTDIIEITPVTAKKK